MWKTKNKKKTGEKYPRKKVFFWFLLRNMKKEKGTKNYDLKIIFFIFYFSLTRQIDTVKDCEKLYKKSK